MIVCVQLHKGNENLKAIQENAKLYAFFTEKKAFESEIWDIS